MSKMGTKRSSVEVKEYEDYRVVILDDPTRYFITSVKYENDKPMRALGIPRNTISADNLSSLRWDLRRMLEAFDKPVLKVTKTGKLVEAKNVEMPSPESLFDKRS